jgi:hypothetical protein
VRDVRDRSSGRWEIVTREIGRVGRDMLMLVEIL